jgi:nitrogen regulatory protein PII
MQNDIKKIEIITDYAFQSRLVKLIDATGVSGYTVLKDVAGKGLRGNKDGHGIAGGFKNCYIMVCCSEEEAKKVVEAIKPSISKYGGICIVSDAHWVIHN